MTLLALSLVLAAAVCHATWNFFVKRIDAGPELVWLVSIIAILLYLPVALWAYHEAQTSFGLAEFGVCAVSAALHLAYFLLLQRGYRHGDLSVVYPTARSTGPMLSAAFAVAVLGEKLTFPVFLGGVAIIVGVFGLTGGLRRKGERDLNSLLFGLAIGSIIGAYTVFDAYAVTAIAISPILLDYCTYLLRASALTPLALRRRDQLRNIWREHRLPVLAIAIFSPLAYVLVLFALTFTPVVYVAPAREVSVLITVMLGTLVLGEGEFRSRMGWAALIMAGMVVLSVS